MPASFAVRSKSSGPRTSGSASSCPHGPTSCVYIEELAKLVDEVPPVPFDQIRHVIDEELSPDVFVRIDAEPVATASIAQIHTALLQSGREVIVKVRPAGNRAADRARSCAAPVDRRAA